MQGPETPGVWWAFLCHATRSCWRLVQASSLAWYQWAKQHLAIRCSPGSWKEGWKDLVFFSHEEPSSIHCISIHNCFVNPQMSGMMQIKLEFKNPSPNSMRCFSNLCIFLENFKYNYCRSGKMGPGEFMVMSHDVDFQWRVEANETHGYVIFC